MRRPGRAPDEGAAAVEFALVSVLLLTILFGILQYGYFFFQSTAVEHAAREGARTASLGIPATVPGPPVRTGCDAFAATVQARAGTADLTRVEADFQDTDTTLGISRGDTVTVRVRWAPQDFGFPFVPFLGPSLDDTATTRIERIGGATPVDCVDTTP